VQQLRVGAADDRFADLEGEPVQGEPTETETTGGAGGEWTCLASAYMIN